MVNSFDEFTKLKEVIVGDNRGFSGIVTPYWESNQTPPLNVRDNAIILGGTIVETATHVRSRLFENDGLKYIFYSYFAEGSPWVNMPRPTLALPADSSYFELTGPIGISCSRVHKKGKDRDKGCEDLYRVQRRHGEPEGKDRFHGSRTVYRRPVCQRRHGGGEARRRVLRPDPRKDQRAPGNVRHDRRFPYVGHARGKKRFAEVRVVHAVGKCGGSHARYDIDWCASDFGELYTVLEKWADGRE